jgi:hypothetical protein
MGAVNQIMATTLAALGFVLGPIMLVWGWVRWVQRPRLRTVPSTLSLWGFIMASTSAVLAISAIAYAQIRTFAYYDPLLMKIMAGGVLLSLAGLVFGLTGIWRANPLRWHAPISAVAMLAFWVLAASME